jgi:ABC-type Na+ efflux pump permease subunit
MEISMERAPRESARRPARAQAGADARMRWAVARRLARREVAGALAGPSLYLMVTLACLVAAVLVKSYLDYVSANGTLVMAEPLKGPLLFAVIAMTGYLGLAAAAGLAGERERGTLEVLFYGPVDAPGYIGGKLLGHLATYVLAITALAAFLGVAALLSGMPLGAETIVLLVASLLPAAAMIAIGLLLAALVGRVRPALALTATAIAVLVAVDAGTEFAASQPGDTLLGSAAGLLSAISAFTSWISPFGYLWRAADGFALGSAGDVLLDLGVALFYSALLTVLAVIALRKRGVARWRE